MQITILLKLIFLAEVSRFNMHQIVSGYQHIAFFSVALSECSESGNALFPEISEMVSPLFC
ncbi:hypothetical protein BG55_01560 [Erwinia mallotivora]|uniref:Uncharacterized protein n=1 Tax=Erwinia mallotivora TaxID=69222 RepID=A0A014Q226_9GAMM|nr:hypothetical protein BG55_01560 [Erwinia mallotivora]